MSQTIKRGIRIFILITVATSILILVLTFKEDTLANLQRMQPLYFLLAFVLLLIYYYFDALRLRIIGKALSYDIPISTGIDIVVSGIFLAAITPFQTGGLPIQLYCLKKRNIPYGQGTLILFMRGVFAIIFHLFALPFIFVMYASLFENPVIKGLMKYLMIIYPLALLLMLFAIFVPAKLVSFLKYIEKKIFRKKKEENSKMLKGILWLEEEIVTFNSGLRLFFTKRKSYFFVSLLITFVSYVFFFSIASAILYGLGIRIADPLEIANLQFLHNFLVYFMPTPGASGIAETLFAVIFSSVKEIPKNILGIYAIIWRFFTFSLGAAIGGFLTLKIINQSGKSFDDIVKEESDAKQN